MKKLFKNRIFQFALVLIAGIFLGWLLFKKERPPALSQTEIQDATVWTCSMHPQIRQSSPGKCPICGMALIPLGQPGRKTQDISMFIHTMTPEAVAMANVQTAPVSFVTPEHEISLTGKIAVNEQKLAVITANFSGRIEKLFIDFTGQTVNKGQRLATIYSPELITAQKELLEAVRNKGINPSLYNAVKEKLRLWKISELQIAQIEESGKTLTEFDVYADITGVVLKREVSKGDYINRGNVLFEIADLSTVWIILDAYESDMPFIKEGKKISFTLASAPGKEFYSTVTFVDRLLNPQTRTIAVRAEAPNPGLQLKPEMFVKAILKSRLSISEKSLLVPKTAVLWTGKRSIVYVKVPDGDMPTFEMREIVLGPVAGEFYIIESGLKSGEEIVVNGVFAIDAAAQLNGKQSMMNRTLNTSKSETAPANHKH